MGLAAFLNALFDSGRVRVSPWGQRLLPAEAAAAAVVLAAREQVVRAEFPGDAPAYCPAAALWAAEMFHHACQLAVYRDVDADAVRQSLVIACPEDAGTASPAANHYSVDLVFQFLPDLTRMAQSAASDDPLLVRLRQWAAAWPYSSVGLPPADEGDGAAPFDSEALAGHPGLLRAYVDRAIERADTVRLADPRVRPLAESALGAFPQLAPAVSRVLLIRH